jgi:hypothetical protein
VQVVAAASWLGYRGQRFGASPSGKAADFDSAIRRFDPSRPSQLFALLKNQRNTALFIVEILKIVHMRDS